MRIFPAQVFERVEMAGRRVSRLRTGNVKPDDARVAVVHGQLGNLERPRRMPHRGQQRDHPDPATVERGHRAALPEALEHRVDDLLVAQSAFDMELGGEPYL